MDQKFTDDKEFIKWVNEERPEFKEQLNWPDWEFGLVTFLGIA